MSTLQWCRQILGKGAQVPARKVRAEKFVDQNHLITSLCMRILVKVEFWAILSQVLQSQCQNV